MQCWETNRIVGRSMMCVPWSSCQVTDGTRQYRFCLFQNENALSILNQYVILHGANLIGGYLNGLLTGDGFWGAKQSQSVEAPHPPLAFQNPRYRIRNTNHHITTLFCFVVSNASKNNHFHYLVLTHSNGIL